MAFGALGVTGGLAYLGSRNLFQKLGQEDNFEVISAFGVAPLLSATLCPIIVHNETNEWIHRFLWNLCGLVVGLLWSF